jgi:hypothetical protein
MAYTGTFIIKGTVIAGTLSNNNIGNAHFVRITATAGTNTITVKDIDVNTLGTVYLHAAGDVITIEKDPTDTLSSSGAVSATAVAPRS